MKTGYINNNIPEIPNEVKIITVLIFLVLTGFALGTLVSATDFDAGTFEKDKPLNLLLECSNNGTYCSSSAVCNVSIEYPNGTSLILNKKMGDTFYPSFNITTPSSTTGTYTGNIMCCDNGLCGYNEFYYSITPNGETSSSSTAIFYIGLLAVMVIFLILSIYSFVTFDNLLNRVGMIGISYLLLIAITFIGWQMADDFITSSPFLISMLRISFWVLITGFFPLLIGGFAWYLIALFKINEIQRLMDKGFSFEDAKRRTGKKYK